MTFTTIILTLATVVLAFATIVLAGATVVLAKYTNDINKREKKNKRENEIRKCILLADQLITQPIPEKITPEFKKMLGELAILKKYFHNIMVRDKLTSHYYSLDKMFESNPLWSPRQWWSANRDITDGLHTEVFTWHIDLED